MQEKTNNNQEKLNNNTSALNNNAKGPELLISSHSISDTRPTLNHIVVP
jgi:hypothetical protein